MAMDDDADLVPPKVYSIHDDAPDLGWETLLEVQYCCGSMQIIVGDLIESPDRWGIVLADLVRVLTPYIATTNNVSERAALETLVKAFLSRETHLPVTARQLNIAALANGK